MQVLIIILIVGLILWITYKHIRKVLKNKREVITAYTGTLGSGKSLLSVQDVLTLYFRQLRKYKRKKLLIKLKLKKKEIIKNYEGIDITSDEPQLISNMPIIIGYKGWGKKKKAIYSKKLTLNHLLLQESIPEGSVLLIDEIGHIASQFDYKNGNIVDCLNEFIRLYRHYVNGYIVSNEQSSNFIELHIRKRINTIHNLSNCFVFWRLIFYYDRQITIAEDINTIDVAQNPLTNQVDTQDNKALHFKFMWYKKRYNSRYLKNRYLRLKKSKLKEFNSLYTNDMIEVPKVQQYESQTKIEKIKKGENK